MKLIDFKTKLVAIVFIVIAIGSLMINIFIVNKYDTKEYIYMSNVENVVTTETKYTLYYEQDRLVKVVQYSESRFEISDFSSEYESMKRFFEYENIGIRGVNLNLHKMGENGFTLVKEWNIQKMELGQLMNTEEDLMKHWLFYYCITDDYISLSKYESALQEIGATIIEQ
ncbi:MAG: hypothetical protein ACK5LV_07865 [Lachnospirales bacterium]